MLAQINTLGFLRDPIWQFIGIILTVILFIAPYFIKRRPRKSLSFTLVSNTSLVSVDDKLKGDVSIKFKNSEVLDLRLIVFSIKNTGNVPIPSADYEREMRVSFPLETQILSNEVFNKTPNSLDIPFEPIMDLELQDYYYQFKPVLLNPNDQFFFKMLVANLDGEITASARIIGLPEIKNVNALAHITTESDAINGYTMGITVFMFICLLTAGPFYIYPSLGGKFFVAIIPLWLALVGVFCFHFSIKRLARHPKFGVALSEILDSLTPARIR